MKNVLPRLILLMLLSGHACLTQAGTLLVFGDSLSAGYGIAREAAWPSLLQTELQRTHASLEVVNASISGETTAGGVRRINALLQQHQPAVVIVELGANDGLRGGDLKLTEKNLEHILKQVTQAGSKVVLVGMRLPPNYGAAYTRNFQALYVKLAKRHRASLVPFLLKGVPPDQFQPDNLHPTAAAQPQILRNVLPVLMRTLNAK